MIRVIETTTLLVALTIGHCCATALGAMNYAESAGFTLNLLPPVGNDYSASDSATFALDLGPTNLGNKYVSSDSTGFRLDLRRLNSGCADSGSFAVSAFPVGDTDRNGHVDVVDLLWFVYAFGSRMGDDNYFPAADLYPCPVDGQVDVADLLTLVANFGQY